MILSTGEVPGPGRSAPRGGLVRGGLLLGGVPGGDPSPGMATSAGSMHPTGMHSCFKIVIHAVLHKAS